MKMVKFCLINKFGIPYKYYDVICADCNWMGQLRDLVCDDWDDCRLCPNCGSDDIEEFEDGIHEEYIRMPTEWNQNLHKGKTHGN